MKSNIAARKLSEAKKQLAQNQKELAAQHATATAKDVHKIDRGDSFAPVKVVGGYENKSSRGTVLQKELARHNDDKIEKNPGRTLLQQKLRKMPSLFKEN
jgi:hypothetical protein